MHAPSISFELSFAVIEQPTGKPASDEKRPMGLAHVSASLAPASKHAKFSLSEKLPQIVFSGESGAASLGDASEKLCVGEHPTSIITTIAISDRSTRKT